jgi:hypothetical protein
MKTKPIARGYRSDDGRPFVHEEPRSRNVGKPRIWADKVSPSEVVQGWETERHYGLIRRYSGGFPIGGGPYAILSISNRDETARHDWREFQQLKNAILGEEWEALEMYPAESRLKDPSNRFYLWCIPLGVIQWGLPGGRYVLGHDEAIAPQRPFPKG